MIDQALLKLRYDQLLSLWHRFCEEHTNLFELTCSEYSDLLKSDIDALEKTLEKKDAVLGVIKQLEQVRVELIRDINNEDLFSEPIVNITSMIRSMQSYEATLNLDGLKRYNQLLISIIENIQTQNKKNQAFLNKAIHSIEELKESFTHNKSYQTYNNKGLARKNQLHAR